MSHRQMLLAAVVTAGLFWLLNNPALQAYLRQ